MNFLKKFTKKKAMKQSLAMIKVLENLKRQGKIDGKIADQNIANIKNSMKAAEDANEKTDKKDEKEAEEKDTIPDKADI